MSKLGNFLGLDSIPILGTQAQGIQPLTLPSSTTDQIMVVGFSAENINRRVDTANYSNPATPLLKLHEHHYRSLDRYNNPSIASSSDTYPQIDLTYHGGTWTLNYSFYNTDSENLTEYIWTASGTGGHIPVTGWTGGNNGATGEIQLSDPNSFDMYHTILDAFDFVNLGGSASVMQSFNASEYSENFYVYTSQTPSTISSLFDPALLKQSTLVSAADQIRVYGNSVSTLSSVNRLYQAYFGGGVWRASSVTLPNPPASVADYPIANGNTIGIFRVGSNVSSSSVFRYMPIIDEQRVFKRSLLTLPLDNGSYIVNDVYGTYNGTYVDSASSDAILVGSGIWHITGTDKYLIQAGFETNEGTSANWRFFNLDSGQSFEHFSTDPTAMPRIGWRNVIASSVVAGGFSTSYGRHDISIT